MCLILQGTRLQIQVLKPCKFVQETGEEVLDFKARQLARQIHLLRFKRYFCLMLNNYSINTLSIEISENQFFRSDFTPICVYMFWLSFLTILNTYKDYFKGCKRLHKCEAKFCSCKMWSEIKFALVHLSLKEAAVFVHGKVL